MYIYQLQLSFLAYCIELEAILQHNIRGEYTVHNGKAQADAAHE